ncbi:hypothetical protein Lal_00008223, partial [Lupinus albus]
ALRIDIDLNESSSYIVVGYRNRQSYRISDEDSSNSSIGRSNSSGSGERFIVNRSRRNVRASSYEENGNIVNGRRNAFPGPRIRYPEPNLSIVVERSSLSTSNVHSDANSEPHFLSMSSPSPEIRRQMHSLMVRLCAGGNHQLEGPFGEEDVSEEEDVNMNMGRTEEEIMASINREIFESDDEDNVENKKACGICQEDYVNEVEIGRLSCEHKFHMECIKQWLMLNNLCPLCRRVAL